MAQAADRCRHAPPSPRPSDVEPTGSMARAGTGRLSHARGPADAVRDARPQARASSTSGSAPSSSGRSESRIGSSLHGRCGSDSSTRRRFRPPENQPIVPAPGRRGARRLSAWLLCARRVLEASAAHTRTLIVHMRQDERPLLEMLARALEVGDVRDHVAYPPTQPSTTWQWSALDDVLGSQLGWIRSRCAAARRRSWTSGCAPSPSAGTRVAARPRDHRWTD